MLSAAPAAAGASGSSVKAGKAAKTEDATLKDAQSRGVIVIKPSQAASPEPISPSAPPQVTPAPATLVQPSATPAVVPSPAPQLVVTPSPAVAPAAAKVCARPLKADVKLAGNAGSAFTRQLRSKLSAGRPVVIDLATPYPVGGDAPAALAPWIAQVKASGGNVTADEYCHESRGMFSFLRKFFGRPAAAPYAAADRYNAVLHVNGLDQEVTQIEFRPRTAT